MSAETEFELVKETWNAFNRNDFEAALATIQPDAVVIPFGAAMEGRKYVGHEGILAW